MNGFRVVRTAAGAMALCGMAGTALADDYIFKGDCSQARIVQNERTVDKLVAYQKYNGVMMMNLAGDECGRDVLHTYQLTTTSRSSSKVVLSFTRNNYRINKRSGNCPNPENWSNGEYGTVEITSHVSQTGMICEVYLMATWSVRATEDPDYKDAFSNRISPLGNGGLVMTGWQPSGAKFWSPLGLTPVQ